jgi:hypothetical protein
LHFQSISSVLTSIEEEVHGKDRASSAGDNFPVSLTHHEFELHLNMTMMNFRHCNHCSNTPPVVSLTVVHCCLLAGSRCRRENFVQASRAMLKAPKRQLNSISHSFLFDFLFFWGNFSLFLFAFISRDVSDLILHSQLIGFCAAG